MAAVLIIAGTLLVSVAAGLHDVSAGLAVAGLLALGFGVDAARDVLPQTATREEGARERLRAVGDGS